MNTAKITERAIATVLQQYAEMQAGVSVRPFQCMAEDTFRPKDESGGNRAYPQIDIRCQTPQINQSQHTESVSCMIKVATNADDDQDHSQLSFLYGAVELVIQNLFDQAKTTDGNELTLLKSVYADEFDSAFYFGGITIDGGDTPFDDDGISEISINITIHYSRR